MVVDVVDAVEAGDGDEDDDGDDGDEFGTVLAVGAVDPPIPLGAAAESVAAGAVVPPGVVG